jgi:mitochondrial inner membrane protein COX18
LDSESFFTLTTLTHTDPTTTLPIILGLITLANIETSQWWMSAADRQRMAQRDERRAALKAQGHIVPNLSEIIRTTLRGASVVRIIIASLVPGVSLSAVIIYFLN